MKLALHTCAPYLLYKTASNVQCIPLLTFWLFPQKGSERAQALGVLSDVDGGAWGAPLQVPPSPSVVSLSKLENELPLKIKLSQS